jgi:hypothetical protein
MRNPTGLKGGVRHAFCWCAGPSASRGQWLPSGALAHLELIKLPHHLTPCYPDPVRPTTRERFVSKRYVNQPTAHQAVAFSAFWYGANPPTPEL